MRQLALFLLLAIPIFIGLGNMPFTIWDEGRIAINTYEMWVSGDLLNITFGGGPEFWNTKPALLHWIQYLFVSIFGFSELSIRLPSAISAFIVCLVVYRLGKRDFGSSQIGLFSAFILVGYIGFIGVHSARTGEYDALLSLWTTLSAIYFFRTIEVSTKHLYWFFLFLALAALTKGVAALLFTPAYAFYALYRKKLFLILRSKAFYLGLMGFALLVGGYYYGRDLSQPGYLNAVFENELGGRFGETIEKHEGSLFYYFDTLVQNVPLSSIILLIPSVWLGMIAQNRIIRHFTIFVAILFISFTFILGAAGTKLDWYYTPIYPFIAIVISIGVSVLLKRIKERKVELKPMTARSLAVAIISLTVVLPYIFVLWKSVSPSYSLKTYGVGKHLSACIHSENPEVDFDVLWDGYDAHNRIYVLLLQDRGYDIRLRSFETVSTGDRVIVSQEQAHEFILENYTFQETKLDEQTSIYTLEHHVE